MYFTKRNNNETNESRSSTPFLIGVCGGTASGKSTLCRIIMDKLDQSNVNDTEKRVVCLSQHSFYRDFTPAEKLQIEKGQFNFDHPDALNASLMKKTLLDILTGKIVKIPTYNYESHTLMRDELITIHPADVVLFEGILIFHFPEIRDLFDMKLFVDTLSDTRLARRVKRDVEERGIELDEVLNRYLDFVKPAFDDFCLPSKKFANIIIPRGGENVIVIDMIAPYILDILDKSNINVVNNVDETECTNKIVNEDDERLR